MNSSWKLVLFVSILAFASGDPIPKKTGFGPGEQDWGWVKVRPGANLFYWLYFTTAKVNSFYDRPLIIWLQGGPGGSATAYGNFVEVGPLNLNLTERPDAWTKHVNIAFLDSPVGAGFSYVDNDSYLNRDNIQVGKDFMAFITEFLKRHPGFKKSPLYLFGESYGGKIAVEMAKQLDEAIKSGSVQANFKGVALLDSWIAPMDIVDGWPSLLLSLGLIDVRSHSKIVASIAQINKTLGMGNSAQATDMWRKLESDIMTYTSGVDFYNILDKVRPIYLQESSPSLDVFTPTRGRVEDELRQCENIMNGPVKKALQIPTHLTHGAKFLNVFNALKGDFMKSVTHVVEHLLDNTNVEVNVLSAQLDLIVDTYGTLHWVDKLGWKGSPLWANAKRMPIVVNGNIEGYVSKAKNLAFYWINRSGHMIPKDNTKTAMEILKRVTKYDAR